MNESKAISLEDFELALEDLPDDTLVSVKSQLENSTSKLKATNQELQDEIDQLMANTPDSEDIKLYKDIITENEQVLHSQKNRIALLVRKLEDRGLYRKEDKKDEKAEKDTKDETDSGVYL